MTKEDLINEIHEYCNHICMMNDYIAVYESIFDGLKTNRESVDVSVGFFGIVLEADTYAMFMETSKLYECSKDSKTLCKLMQVIRNNQKLFPVELKNVYIDDKGQVFPEAEEKQGFIVEDVLNKYEHEFVNLQPIVHRIKKRRDKFYAHNDRKYFRSIETLTIESPISIEEMHKLADFAESFCNTMLIALNGESFSCHSDNARDLHNLLNQVKKNIKI